MQLIISSVAAAVVLCFAATQSRGQSCCKKPEGMQALALNASFKASHEPPAPFDYKAEKGETISIPVTGGGNGSAFYVPADGPTDKVLIVFHEWWGLNDYIKREAENWQKALGGKVAVYAVDLYDGKVATTADEAGKLMHDLDPKRGEAIISGVIARAGKNKKIATIGWCMGGSWSFTGALLAGKEAAGCVMYYGFPEKDESKISNLKTNVLYIYGTKDNFIKKSDVDGLGKSVKATGHTFEIHSYDAVHAFANPSNPKYDEKAAAEAHVFALKFIKSSLSID